MKLLIITQVVDTQHPILGFFCRWIAEFAKHCEHVHVIALQVGEYQLPQNVTVHSLGKEAGASRLQYLRRFYRLIWTLRAEYDHVFVHMNQIYVILGAAFWRITGKRIGLWYMHGSVPFSLRIAAKLTNYIFTGSVESCRITSNKIVVTGHGIDTNHFTPDTSIFKTRDLITVGRITASKNLLQLIDIVAEVRKKTDVSLTIVGGAVTEAERVYESELRSHIDQLGMTPHVHVVGRVAQTDLPAMLNSSKVFVTVAQNGSLDKAILEAMAVGLPVVSMAPGTMSLQLGDQQVDTQSEFITRVQTVFLTQDYSSLININQVHKKHSIDALIPKILFKIV